MADFTHNGEKIPTGPSKDPDSTIPYGVDWSQWLREGETISSSEWLVPTGITNESETFSTESASITISGGVVGTQYTITNRITTSLGVIEDRSMKISVREK